MLMRTTLADGGMKSGIEYPAILRNHYGVGSSTKLGNMLAVASGDER